MHQQKYINNKASKDQNQTNLLFCCTIVANNYMKIAKRDEHFKYIRNRLIRTKYCTYILFVGTTKKQTT